MGVGGGGGQTQREYLCPLPPIRDMRNSVLATYVALKWSRIWPVPNVTQPTCTMMYYDVLTVGTNANANELS